MKAVLFRRAKTRPGVGDGSAPKAARPSFEGEARTTRMLLGKVLDVGVEGSILMPLCGLLLSRERPVAETAGEVTDADVDEVEDVLECVW